MSQKGRRGEWVQLYKIALGPGQRAQQLPEDTKKVPLELRIRGILAHDALLGENATIITSTGRKVTGTLVAVNPRYEYDYGKPVPELLSAGLTAVKLLTEGGDTNE